MALRNSRHELFCQYRSEGETIDKAYVLAGYKANAGNAARLNRNDTIALRVRELTDRRAKMADVTVEALTREYDEAIQGATADKAYAAVMAGIMGKAKLHGLIVDKQKVEQGRLDSMSNDALAEHIERELERIAEGRPEGAGDPGGGTGEKAGPEPDNELHPVPEAT